MTMTKLRPAIVLIEPQEDGNVGATARAMANMGLDRLLLVRPVSPPGRTARAFAVGAGHILDQAEITDSLSAAIEPYQKIIGTTSGRGRQPSQSLVTPRELPASLRAEADGTRVAILFGPEASGLDNEALSRCAMLVQVPCDSRQPTLNLAQAVLVVAYELQLARLPRGSSPTSRPAAAAERDIAGLFDQLAPMLTAIGFARDDTFAGVLRELRHLVARAGLTSREVTILRGICRRAAHRLNRPAS